MSRASPGRPRKPTRLLGPLTTPVGPAEILVSIGSSLLGIAAVYGVTLYFAGDAAAVVMVASMGSSAVLLFGVPHGALSQPWPLFGGHLVSAILGVTCAMWIPNPVMAAAMGVALAIGAMQWLRCVHPPGGATALGAVLGGPTVHALGYGFVLVPVLINVVIIFSVAVVANYPFAWRRYPVTLASYAGDETKRQPARPIRPEVLQHAVRELNVVVDITPEELNEIARRALVHAEEESRPLQVPLGPRFVNAQDGERRTLRKSLIPEFHSDRRSQSVTFNIVDAAPRRKRNRPGRGDPAQRSAPGRSEAGEH